MFALHENDASRRAAATDLTILVTLYNYAQHIEECLASATAAAERLVGQAEILVVNDASTDDSLDRALRWLRKSKLPMRVADKKFNTGLADARNTGVTLARSPSVFMMDADNLVCADALRQLLELIRRRDCAAAYSMIVRFAGNPENRIALLSYYGLGPGSAGAASLHRRDGNVPAGRAA